MKLAVIGTGYVGLVTGTCFAEAGHRVTCLDRDTAKVATLRAGGMPIYEPGLEELIRRNVRDGRLSFTADQAEAASGAEVVFIAVGAPSGTVGEEGEADLTHVLAAAEALGPRLTVPCVVVVKSTVPVGSAAKVREALSRVAAAPFEIASNPEFMKEGTAVDDFTRPDRVVVGVESERARAVLSELYAPFVRAEQPVLFMDLRSAELTKYAANAMLATRVSFMNEIAALCDGLGADVDAVRRGLGGDRRIGQAFLHPGIGFGGSWFPKGVRSLLTTARGVGLDFDLLRAVERVNDRQKRALVEKARKHFGGSLAGRHLGVWGLAFKPKTDDLREAPSLTVIEGLVGGGATVRAHDPVAREAAARLLPPAVALVDDPYAAAEGAEALFLVTEWSEFRQPDWARLKGLMKTPVLFDGRNVWDAARARAAGFTYYGIGRSAARAG
jgi:UDPglucose 6-dehydrogenase